MIRSLFFLFLLMLSLSSCHNEEEKIPVSPPSYEPNDEAARKTRAKNKVKAITYYTTILKDSTYASARIARREFDREGRMTRWWHYTKGEENSVDSFRYDWDKLRQMLTLTAWQNNDLSESPAQGINIYSPRGQLTGVSYDLSKEGTYNGRIVYHYNTNGQLTKEVRAHRLDTLIHVSEHFYDSLRYRTMTVKDRDTVRFRWDHEKNISYRELPDRKIEYHYDLKGNLLLEMTLKNSGEPVSYTRYWYDPQGNQVAELYRKYRIYNAQIGCIAHTDTPVHEIRYQTYKHEFYD